MMKLAHKRREAPEFVIWDGSDEALEKIKTLLATSSISHVTVGGERTGTISIATGSRGTFVDEGDYVFFDSYASLQSLTAELFLTFYEV